MAGEEYIERGALLKTPPFTKYGGDLSQYTEGYLDCADEARKAVNDAPAADVVSLDDVREAFQAYILEMTCSKYGTPEETQFARDIVRQAVDIVLGERKEKP